jgi:alpha-tubulin suppressor-like RCC1 family protein
MSDVQPNGPGPQIQDRATRQGLSAAAARARCIVTCAQAIATAAILAACGGGGGSTGTASTSYSVGGTASGLTGSGLVLQNNAGDDLSVTANGSFNFGAALASGSAYQVVVKTQPASPAQVCSVTNGGGTVATANVTAVAVTCVNAAAYSVGGTVTGLTGSGLVLQDSGASDLSVAASGAFAFRIKLASGAAYQVSVKTQPSNPAQTCTVASGSGTVGLADVANVAVTCVASDADTRPLQLSLSAPPNAAMGALVPYSVTETQGITLTSLTWYFDNAAGGHAYPGFNNGTLQVWNAPGVHSVRVVATASNGRMAQATATLAAVSEPLAGGEFHSCGLTLDAHVQCWGYGGNGELGNGANSNQATPVTVTGLANVVGLAAGEGHSCAILADGSAKCWGDNGSGELGNGSNTGHSAAPVSVVGLSGITGLAAGRYHTCALKGDGSVACFGRNDAGELGSGTAVATSGTPVAIAGLSNVVAISAGRGLFTCALKADTTVACWGDNSARQIDARSGTSSFTTPQTVVTSSGAPLNRVLALRSGKEHSCAIVDDGSYAVYCWGNNNYNQVSPTSGDQVATPVPAAAGVLMLSLTDYSSCALDVHSAFKCWGSNYYGESDGNGVAGRYVTSPTALTGLQGTGLPEFAGGGNEFLCALQGDGGAKCVGRGSSDQLGNGASTDTYAVQLVSVPAGTFWTWLGVVAR